MNSHIFIQLRVEEVAPNGGRPNCPTRMERFHLHPSENLHRKPRVRISTFPTATKTISCFSSPPRILATLVVPFARARGLQFGLSLILIGFSLIHCNTKDDQCIILGASKKTGVTVNVFGSAQTF